MSPEFSFSNLLGSGESLFALQEPGGPISLHWGVPDSSATESLYFRKFYAPRVKDPSIWEDFPASATLALTESRKFKSRDFSNIAPIALPKGEPFSDRKTWIDLCQKSAAAILCENAFKLVPTRKCSVSISPEERLKIHSALFHRIFFPKLENAYRFLVKRGSSIFFGITPELLFLREKGKIFVPAVAGTRALSAGVPESDLRDELLASRKDRLEHDWVVEGIRESLQSLGLNPTCPSGPEVMRTSRLLHLYTPITATDSPALTHEKLLEALHPTPAIGGQPKAAAVEFLFENEGWDRGLFSAPLLFRSPDRDLCLVAIRSALLTANELHFFAGAGYVKGSTAEMEWLETERKLQVMQSLLFGDESWK